jgi:hypothetical protein
MLSEDNLRVFAVLLVLPVVSWAAPRWFLLL